MSNPSPMQRPMRARCPVCPGSVLLPNERDGVEIDFCPACGGIWLDPGELDRLVEGAAPGGQRRPRALARPDFVDSDFPDAVVASPQRSSWLREIFD